MEKTVSEPPTSSTVVEVLPSTIPKTEIEPVEVKVVQKEAITSPVVEDVIIKENKEREKEVYSPEEDSAAALEKAEDDSEDEDKFRYTKGKQYFNKLVKHLFTIVIKLISDKIKRKYKDLPGDPVIIRLLDIPPHGLGLSLSGKNENQKKSIFVVDIKSTSELPLNLGDELLEVGVPLMMIICLGKRKSSFWTLSSRSFPEDPRLL